MGRAEKGVRVLSLCQHPYSYRAGVSYPFEEGESKSRSLAAVVRGYAVCTAPFNPSSQRGAACVSPQKVLALQVHLHALEVAVMLHDPLICVWREIFRNSSPFGSLALFKMHICDTSAEMHIFSVSALLNEKCCSLGNTEGGGDLGLCFISAHALGL